MKHLRLSTILAAATLACTVAAGEAGAQFFKPRPMSKPGTLIRKQDLPEVSKDLANVITPENSYVIVSISKQRAYLKTGEQVYIDTPISSGKRAGMTPTGSFKVTEKDKDHRSSIYGDYVSRKTGVVVRSGVSTRVDSAPAGTKYRGAPMKWFCRLTGNGVGMHIGILPGYPASHGCIRLPEQIAPLIYEKVKLGTPVTIEP